MNCGHLSESKDHNMPTINCGGEIKLKLIEECECHKCIADFNLKNEYGFPRSSSKMIVCPICGNKRCPKASDHRLDCTNSNAPGQPGSIFL